MKRLLTVLLVLVATLALALPAAAASPSGRGTTTVRYRTAVYNDFVMGADVQCKGIHQWGPRWPGDATSGGRDIYRCRSLSGPFANAEPGSSFEYPGGWVSDYFFEARGIFVFATRPVHVRVSGNGLSYFAIAYYSD